MSVKPDLPQPQSLPPCIRKIWYVSNSSSLLRNITQPMVFDGCFELIICRNNGFAMVFDDRKIRYNSGIYLGGQITRPMSLALEAQTELLFLKLEHGYINAVCREDMTQFNNQSVALQDINAQLYFLLAPLLESEKLHDIFQQLHVFFQSSVNKSQLFSSSACQILADNRDFSQNKQFLQHKFGLSPRGFENRFKRSTGLNPKKFAHLSRLRHITEALQFTEHTTSLTQMALDNGFYDQAHFNRAMSDFIGAAPGKINFQKVFVPGSQEKVRFFTI